MFRIYTINVRTNATYCRRRTLWPTVSNVEAEDIFSFTAAVEPNLTKLFTSSEE
jgi:hypothetical protein